MKNKYNGWYLPKAKTYWVSTNFPIKATAMRGSNNYKMEYENGCFYVNLVELRTEFKKCPKAEISERIDIHKNKISFYSHV